MTKSQNNCRLRRRVLLAAWALIALLAARALPHGPLGGPRRPEPGGPPRAGAGRAVPSTPTSSAACRSPPATRGAALAWLADLLEQNNIAYFLAYGTLLGGIRNGQIVPWTCDVDVMIPDLHAPHVQQFFRDLVCDDQGVGGSARCANYCAVGRVNGAVFHLRFNPDVVEVERCPGRGGGRGPKRRPGLRPDGQINNVPGAPIFIDVYALISHNASHLYFVGSKGNGNPSGNVFTSDQIYPLNPTGVSVGGRRYPSPRESEVVLEAKYGRRWRTPDDSWERGWCLSSWCWTRKGVFRVGGTA